MEERIYPNIESVKDGFIVNINRKTILPGIFLSHLDAARGMERYFNAANSLKAIKKEKVA